jgi:superfamily II DNA or RNA helicase
MNKAEFDTVKNFTYDEYCNYLKTKYGKVPAKYGSKKNKKPGLFIHHIGEDTIPSLSNPTVRKENDVKYQMPDMLCYCDYLEHLLLHIMIGRVADPAKHLGLNGPCMFIIPALKNFYTEGLRHPKWGTEYYDKIIDNKDVFELLVAEYNQLVKDIDVVLDHNSTLYVQTADSLDSKGKALVVLGTGLGKTTTALQYLKANQYRALVIGPNNIIKKSWGKYSISEEGSISLVTPITYSAFANAFQKNQCIDLHLSQYQVVILDEVHHAGYNEELGKGAKTWGKAIQFLFDTGIKVLGLTATPDRSDGICLGDTFFDDCVCEGLTVEDAIDQQLIHPFSYITALYDTDGLAAEIKDLTKNVDETDAGFRKLRGQLDIALNNIPTVHDILIKHMPKNKRKGIIFIAEIEDAEEAQSTFQAAFPNATFKVLHSKLTKEERKQNREWFEKTDEGYLIAINMISEGAHYPGVNTLIMFRRTKSYVLFTQQIGRAITLTKDNDGPIANPEAIVFDFVNNISTVKYNDRVKDLSKPRLDADIRKALYRSEARKSGQIIVEDETHDFVEKMRELKDYVDSSWEDWEIEILTKYYTTEGAEGVQRRIDEEWERRYPGSLTT